MSNIFEETSNILLNAVMDIRDLFVKLFPEILAAVVVVLAGWLLSKVISRIARGLLSKLGLDRWVKREGLSPALAGKNFSSIFAAILKWYIVAVFFIQALGLIESSFVLEFMNILNQYIHKIFWGVVILVLAALLAEHLKKAIITTNIQYAKIAGNVVKFLVLYFVLVLTLQVLGLEANLLADIFKIAFGAFAVAIAITVGIGFGLAFSDDARKIIKRVKK